MYYQTKALSSWDQYLQKRAEKLKAVHAAKKEKAKSAMEERKQGISYHYLSISPLHRLASSNICDAAFVDSKTKKKAPETEEGRRSKAELELLLAGDKEAEAGFNMRDLANEEKNKDKKKKKDKKEKEEKREQTFNVDMNDPRFGAIFNNKEFAIDRSNPEYPILLFCFHLFFIFFCSSSCFIFFFLLFFFFLHFLLFFLSSLFPFELQ